MIEKKDIKIGSVYINKDYNMHMVIRTLSPGHESHLGIISLKSMHFTWTGSLRDFQAEFITL